MKVSGEEATSTFKLGQDPSFSSGTLTGRLASYCLPQTRDIHLDHFHLLSSPTRPLVPAEMLFSPVPMTGLTPTNISVVIPILRFQHPRNRSIHLFANKKSAIRYCLFGFYSADKGEFFFLPEYWVSPSLWGWGFPWTKHWAWHWEHAHREHAPTVVGFIF